MDKEFIEIMELENGRYRKSSIYDVAIGKPCILLLTNGEIVRTSKVRSWTTYGSTRIETEHSTYYAA